MPQLDIFIFFSQYFIFLFSFIVFYLFIVKYLVKEVDYMEQLGKYKMVSILNTAAIMRMIFDKLNKKSSSYKELAIQMKKNLNKTLLFEIVIQQSFYKKYSAVFLSGVKKEKSLKFNNYIFK